jgi:hypothetical protein
VAVHVKFSFKAWFLALSTGAVNIGISGGLLFAVDTSNSNMICTVTFLVIVAGSNLEM